MHFDAALNLVWMLLGLLALIGTIRAALRRHPSETSAPAWLHIVRVALIVAALFPYISATDDVLRIEDFNSQHGHQHPSKESRNHNLMRLYETMDTPLVCPTCEVSLTFFFISLVFTPLVTALERIAPLRAGRSPPTLLTA